jgi:hypothetical protein
MYNSASCITPFNMDNSAVSYISEYWHVYAIVWASGPDSIFPACRMKCGSDKVNKFPQKCGHIKQ